MLEFKVKSNQFPSRRWFGESLKGFETFIVDFSNRIEKVEVVGFQEVSNLPNDLEDRGDGVFVFDPKVELTEIQKFHNDSDRVWSVIEKLQNFRKGLENSFPKSTFLHIFHNNDKRVRHDRQLDFKKDDSLTDEQNELVKKHCGFWNLTNMNLDEISDLLKTHKLDDISVDKVLNNKFSGQITFPKQWFALKFNIESMIDESLFTDKDFENKKLIDKFTNKINELFEFVSE